MTTWPVDSAHIFFYAVAALLPVANPVGMSAPFFAMTRHLENHERKALARRVATYFFLLVVGTVLFGRLVLEIFSLTVGVVDIAGGLVLFHAAWGMLQGGGAPTGCRGVAEDFGRHGVLSPDHAADGGRRSTGHRNLPRWIREAPLELSHAR